MPITKTIVSLFLKEQGQAILAERRISESLKVMLSKRSEAFSNRLSDAQR